MARFALLDANPLRAPGLSLPDLPAAPSCPVVWSGSLADDPFARDLATWGPRGWSALNDWCDAIAPPLAAAGRRVLLRPHARHVLSDVQRCLRFLDQRAGAPFALALEPAALFEPTMLSHADDHLTRIVSFLAPRAEVIILSDAALSPATPDDESAPVRRPPLGQGALNEPLLRALLNEHLSPGVPIML